jgi:hypothetical protein
MTKMLLTVSLSLLKLIQRNFLIHWKCFFFDMNKTFVLCVAPTIHHIICVSFGRRCAKIMSIEGWTRREYEEPMAKQTNSKNKLFERPQLMCDYPLNLSILIRGGKETKWDSLSSGERNGISSARRVMDFTVHWPIPCKGGSIILRI